jgi:hypothetical protein
MIKASKDPSSSSPDWPRADSKIILFTNLHVQCAGVRVGILIPLSLKISQPQMLSTHRVAGRR